MSTGDGILCPYQSQLLRNGIIGNWEDAPRVPKATLQGENSSAGKATWLRPNELHFWHGQLSVNACAATLAAVRSACNRAVCDFK
jgi:hypothetical protein